MVALERLLDAALVRAQLVLGGPRRAVDALQLRVLLGSAPVGRGDARQRPAVADHARARQVRAAAEVAPEDLARLAVDVLVDRELRAADLDGLAVLAELLAGSALEADELELVRLVGHELAGLLLGDDAAREALALPDDALHVLGDGLEVLGREGLGDVEVEVEAVGDGRADAELRLRVDLLHGLRHDVRRRVAQDREPVGRVDPHGLDDVAGGDIGREVLQLPVDAHGDDGAVGEQREPRARLRHLDRLPGRLRGRGLVVDLGLGDVYHCGLLAGRGGNRSRLPARDGAPSTGGARRARGPGKSRRPRSPGAFWW